MRHRKHKWLAGILGTALLLGVLLPGLVPGAARADSTSSGNSAQMSDYTASPYDTQEPQVSTLPGQTGTPMPSATTSASPGPTASATPTVRPTVTPSLAPSTGSSITVTVKKPGKPTVRVKGAKKQIKISWSHPADVDGYLIQYGRSASFKADSTTNLAVTNAATTSKTIKKLAKKKKYYVRVRSYVRRQGYLDLSAWSKKTKAKTK